MPTTMCVHSSAGLVIIIIQVANPRSMTWPQANGYVTNINAAYSEWNFTQQRGIAIARNMDVFHGFGLLQEWT